MSDCRHWEEGRGGRGGEGTEGEGWSHDCCCCATGWSYLWSTVIGTGGFSLESTFQLTNLAFLLFHLGLQSGWWPLSRGTREQSCVVHGSTDQQSTVVPLELPLTSTGNTVWPPIGGPLSVLLQYRRGGRGCGAYC